MLRGMRIKKEEYVAPELEVVDVIAEQGFLNSIEDPSENEEMDW